MLDAIEALFGALEVGRHVPEFIIFIRTNPGLSACIAAVIIAGGVAAVCIRRMPPENFPSIR